MTGYADDLSGRISSRSDTNVITEVNGIILELNNICNEKQLHLNPTKTMYLQFHTQRKISEKRYLFNIHIILLFSRLITLKFEVFL